MELLNLVKYALSFTISLINIVIKEVGSWFTPSEWKIIGIAFAIVSSLTAILKRKSN